MSPGGRRCLLVAGKVNKFIPNPTFDRVGRPGAQEEYFKVGNPEGKSYRELIGEPMRAIRRAHVKGAFPALCARCGEYEAPGVDKRFT